MTDERFTPGVGTRPTRRPGKKNVRWDSDAEILARISTVTTMLLRGARQWQIAEALGVSLRTVKTDVARAKTLWKQDIAETMEDHRARAIAHYREMQMRAWSEFDSTKDARLLEVVKNCEDQIAKLLGLSDPQSMRFTTNVPVDVVVEWGGVPLPE